MTDEIKNAEEWKNKGNKYFDKDDYLKAVQCYIKSIALNENDANVYYLLGNAYFKLKLYKSAIIVYSSSINLNPALKFSYVKLNLCFTELGKKNALIVCNELIESFPNVARMYINRAFVLNSMRRYKKALKDYEYAIKICNNNYDILMHVYSNIAVVYSNLKQSEKAAEYLAKAKELGYVEENKDE